MGVIPCLALGQTHLGVEKGGILSFFLHKM